MEVERRGKLYEAYTMNGGSDINSYSNNSTYQKEAINATKELINEAIAKSLNIKILTKSIRITDMGCSVGPNTFLAIQNIIEAIQNKTSEFQINELEFQVFFNDHTSNDFNTLFNSLPYNPNYYPMAVPGSFHGRLFPNSFLHIVHSSYALQWLSQAPKALVDQSSHVSNKGRIYYTNAGDEVIKAYADQFGEDMDNFLHCRAKEIVPGGLILLTFPGRLNDTPHSQVFSNVAYDHLGSCLMELAHKGKVSKEKVDSFIIPVYFTSPQEVEAAVERNGSFSIQKIVCMPFKKSNNNVQIIAKITSSHMRAGFESLLRDHFGEEMIMDDLFDSFAKKLEKSNVFQFGVAFSLFVLLKREI